MTSVTAIRSLLLIAYALLVGHTIVVAQSAAPLRIEFRPGSYTATVHGSLRGRQQMNYVTAARKNQRFTLTLASDSAKTLKLKLRDPQDAEVALHTAGPHQWTGTIAETGDYEIWVLRVTGQAGTSSYRLAVAIR